MRMLCKLGWHKWGGWQDFRILFHNTFLGAPIGSYTVPAQKRTCRECNKYQERKP
jgi:hypothetical protein